MAGPESAVEAYSDFFFVLTPTEFSVKQRTRKK